MRNPGERAAPGTVRKITSPANPLVKSIRALHRKKHRDDEKLFVAEGQKLVTDAIDDGWPMRTLVHGDAIADDAQAMNVAARARARGAAILQVSDRVLAAVCRRDNPQRMVGVFEQRWTALDAVRPAPGDIWVGLDRVRDPGNLGTIVRTADAAGAAGVMLIGECTDPWSSEAVRASMGSIFHVAMARCTTDEFIAWKAGWPGRTVGTHLEGAIDHRRLEPDGAPVLLLMGNEQQGLPDELAALCDDLVRIAMPGRADSLNLAVAAGIMLFELRRTS